eukprot:m.242349 g.242349  ORF g.242349 m.242349 type:complete len:400 (+) comp14019_c0_seq1:32-1231(+)
MMAALWCAAVAALFVLTHALNNGVGLTPAMGYNTWNDFRCSGITADHVKMVADKFIELNLPSVGYEYVNIDDCWATSRGSDGRLVPDPTNFPNGMKAVADYVHSKGLKFGIYTDRGTSTCDGRPASQGYEAIDAETFADWGVDYLKEDSCSASDNHGIAFEQYGLMRDALNKTGREIYFSLCGWNAWYAPVGWSLGNSWRIAGDCNEWPSIYNAIRTNEGLSQFARPGGWNDPDMLVGSSPQAAVHNTPDQARTQFSLWAVMAAPLLIGSNILNLSAYDLETYTNAEVIAIDQDLLGVQGSVILTNCPPFLPLQAGDSVPACQQIWARPLADGSVAMNFLNFDTKPAAITCDADCFRRAGLGQAHARDLWAHQELGIVTAYTANVAANGASVTMKFTPL